MNLSLTVLKTRLCARYCANAVATLTLASSQVSAPRVRTSQMTYLHVFPLSNEQLTARMIGKLEKVGNHVGGPSGVRRWNKQKSANVLARLAFLHTRGRWADPKLHSHT